MKKIILLSFLFLIVSCSNDPDLITLPPVTDFSPDITISISQSDGTSLTSCPEVADFSFLIKDNSLISGELGKYGKLEVSSDNNIFIYSCTISSNENINFITQRFGGMLTTIDGEIINLEGRLGVNRLSHKVNGAITINILNSNNSNNSKTYDVIGDINESGSCEIESFPRFPKR